LVNAEKSLLPHPLHETDMEYWKLIVLFASCFIGGMSIFFFKKENTKRIKLLLSFSGAYLFAITILHLIPEVYEAHDHSIGLFVLGGFLFQIILEQFSDSKKGFASPWLMPRKAWWSSWLSWSNICFFANKY